MGKIPNVNAHVVGLDNRKRTSKLDSCHHKVFDYITTYDCGNSDPITYNIRHGQTVRNRAKQSIVLLIILTILLKLQPFAATEQNV